MLFSVLFYKLFYFIVYVTASGLATNPNLRKKAMRFVPVARPLAETLAWDLARHLSQEEKLAQYPTIC